MSSANLIIVLEMLARGVSSIMGKPAALPRKKFCEATCAVLVACGCAKSCITNHKQGALLLHKAQTP